MWFYTILFLPIILCLVIGVLGDAITYLLLKLGIAEENL